MLTGGCYCGAVRYAADGPGFSQTICHCVDCRRVSGAPCVAWFTMTNREYRITQGTAGRFQSSPGVTRTFCAACGTPLTYQHDDRPGEIDVTTASLDDPEAAPPLDHTYAASRPSWMVIGDSLPRYLRTRSEGQKE